MPYTVEWQVLRLAEDDQILAITSASDAESLEVLRRLGTIDAT